MERTISCLSCELALPQSTMVLVYLHGARCLLNGEYLQASLRSSSGPVQKKNLARRMQKLPALGTAILAFQFLDFPDSVESCAYV